MSVEVDESARQAFERAFLAMSYLCGKRGEELRAPLGELGADAQRVYERLTHAERAPRAETLAGELARLARSLQARSLW
jgi:hypothetical protein